ncbi:MAG: DedD protein [Rhodoferax sp.]|jgi:DedD protein
MFFGLAKTMIIWLSPTPERLTMAFFKLRKSGDASSATPAQPESVEAMRRRAKYRLIGAALLVLLGVVGLPLLFDKQPRPIAVDLAIDIPDKNNAKPLTIPAPAVVPEGTALLPMPAAVPATSAPPAPAVVAAIMEDNPTPVPVVVVPDAPKLGPKTEPRSADPVPEKASPPAANVSEAAKIRALLEGRTLASKSDASDDRFVVQVGAFSDAARVREARLKLEQAGLKTYTQVVETKDGNRTRVRVGPFTSRTDAEQAVAKIKRLDLPAALLTL